MALLKNFVKFLEKLQVKLEFVPKKENSFKNIIDWVSL